MLVGNFELNPALMETDLGVAQAVFLPLKETTLKHTVTLNDGNDIVIEYFYP